MQPELLHQFWHGQSAKNMNTFFFLYSTLPNLNLFFSSETQTSEKQRDCSVIIHFAWVRQGSLFFFCCFCILCAVKFPFNQFALSVIRFVQVTGALFRAADVYIWLLLEFLMLSPRMIFIASATYFGGDFLSCFLIPASGRSMNKNVVKKKKFRRRQICIPCK